MISDSFFVQGVSHQVCEDYALHGPGYAIVSDGCSNGGGPSMNTDWGSRIMCKVAEMHVEHIHTSLGLPAIGEYSRRIIETIPNLSNDCLTATLLALRTTETDFEAYVIGDGVVGGKRKDGRWKIHVFDFNSAPFYLKYDVFGNTENYFSHFGDKYRVATYFGRLMDEPLADLPEQWDQLMSLTEKEYTIKPGHSHNFSFPIEEYEFAFVCTDGVQSFYKTVATESSKHNESIHVLSALRVLCDFVTIRPSFARLQSNWAFKQDKLGTFTRRGWKNSDDVAMGVVHVGT